MSRAVASVYILDIILFINTSLIRRHRDLYIYRRFLQDFCDAGKKSMEIARESIDLFYENLATKARQTPPGLNPGCRGGERCIAHHVPHKKRKTRPARCISFAIDDISYHTHIHIYIYIYAVRNPSINRPVVQCTRAYSTCACIIGYNSSMCCCTYSCSVSVFLCPCCLITLLCLLFCLVCLFFGSLLFPSSLSCFPPASNSRTGVPVASQLAVVQTNHLWRG